jgi:hypothetical protein
MITSRVLLVLSLITLALPVQAKSLPVKLSPTKIKPVAKSFVMPTTRVQWSALLGVPASCDNDFSPISNNDTGVYIERIDSNVNYSKVLVGVTCGRGAHSFGFGMYMLDKATGAKHALTFTQYKPATNILPSSFVNKTELLGDYGVTFTPTKITITHVNSWLAGTLGSKHVYTMDKTMLSNPLLTQAFYNPSNSLPENQWLKVYDISWPVNNIKNTPIN